jgi:hypothetical protein
VGWLPPSLLKQSSRTGIVIVITLFRKSSSWLLAPPSQPVCILQKAVIVVLLLCCCCVGATSLPMQTMLGGWDKNNTSGKHAGSLLTQKIATDELADAFMAFNTNYHDTGLFGVYAVTDRYVLRHLGLTDVSTWRP